MKEQKSNDLLNELIKIGKENILDFDLNSMKFGDIMNNLDKKGIEENQKKSHQKCNTSISNEEFTNQMMKEINSGGLDEIYEILNEQENDESANKSHSHSRHNTETFDYLRFSNYPKANNIKEFQIDDRKTVDVFDKLHVYTNIDDDSDNDEENNLNQPYNDEEEGDGDLGTIMGMKLEQFDNENEGILLNENGKNLVDNLKNDNKYIKTGTKIDIVEEFEGKLFNPRRAYKELEKYINKIDEPEYKSELQNNNKKVSKKIIYDMLSTTNSIKIYKELTSINGVIFVFDKNNNIFCSTQKGNIAIYNLNEEKKLKELDNPFKEDSKNNVASIITAMSTDEKYIISAYNNGKIALYRKGRLLHCHRERR